MQESFYQRPMQSKKAAGVWVGENNHGVGFSRYVDASRKRRVGGWKRPCQSATEVVFGRLFGLVVGVWLFRCLDHLESGILTTNISVWGFLWSI